MRSAPRRRPEQVGEVIRQVIAELLLREVRDPRIGLVTVTGVRVSPDLAQARVAVLVHGDPAQQAEALEGLRSAAGFLRSRIARSLETRTPPDLEFEVDRGVEHAARIDRLLADLRREEGV
jgi:ribosome-binding factor A